MIIDRIKDSTSIIVSGHRGYKSKYPENTLLGFKQALDLGVSMIEFDLRMSKDRIVVVIHDDTVDRTTNGSGQVRDLTAEELKALDAGGWLSPVYEGIKIPTLEELCQLLLEYPEALLGVEIKSSEDAMNTVDEAVKLLEKYNLLSRCVFISFEATVLSYLHDHYGQKTQGFKEEVMYNFVPGKEGTYSKMWAIAMEMSLLNPKDVEKFREMGLQVWSYCPNTEKQVHYSMGCGAQLMTCDDPVPALKLKQLIEG